MTRRRNVAAGILAVLVGVAAAGRIFAGGWGVLTIRDFPDAVVAGEPFRLTFAVRGHGRMLSSGLAAHVVATRDHQRVQAAAAPAAEQGHYTVSVVLPSAGEWMLTIRTSYGDRQAVRLPLQAIARGASPPILSAAQRGHRLFLAKGCATCHTLEGVASNHAAPVGPPLTKGKYQPEYLARLLADPAAAATRPAGSSPWTMPDLDLTAREIEGLVAFLTSGAQTSRATDEGGISASAAR